MKKVKKIRKKTKKPAPRKNLPPKALALETAAITQFLFDRTTPKRGMKLPLALVFLDYQDWRKLNKFEPTILTIDGFGRLFPHVYPRKAAYWSPAKHTLKCVFNMGLK